MDVQVNVLSSTVVTGGKLGGLPPEKLSPIDASPLLLKTLNCPALKFGHDLQLDRLQQATAALLQEYPIIGGRIKKVPKQDIASHPWLKAAPYCIDLAAADAGALLVEARAAAAAAAISLNGALAAPFSMTSSKVQLPPWYQPLDPSALLRGKEPLLKLQLTHCSDGGCILAATMPHLLVDSHSSTLLLTRLAELYRQTPSSSSSSSSSSTPTTAAAVAAAAGPAAEGFAAANGATHSSGMPGVACHSLRTSGSAHPVSRAPAAAAAAAASMLLTAPAVAAEGIVGAAAVVQMAGPPASKGASMSSESWRKHMLQPAASTQDWQSPGALKALSLDLQSAEAAGLRSTLGWLCAAVKEGVAAAQKFPGGASRLTARLLTIPKADVMQLKALAAAGSLGEAARHISTNDAVSALVWLAFCELRGRPLPGSSQQKHSKRGGCTGGGGGAADAAAGTGALGMAVDLRQNCRDLRQQLPADYFGNAAWCLHIANPGAAESARQSWDGSGSPHADSFKQGGCSYVPALQAAAAAVRGGLSSFRHTPQAGGRLLQLVAAQQAAPKSVLVRNLSRLAVKVDAFITSWNFPADAIDFGHGPAAEYACVVRPTPPWQAAVLPCRPDEGAVRLLLTLPASAAAALKRSAVLQQLVPHASFMA